MFKSEGQHRIVITEAGLCTSPYDKTEQDLAVFIKGRGIDAPEQEDYWYGVLNEEYGIGNSAGKKRWELTKENLERIGWKHGTKFTKENLQTLVGIETEFGVKEGKEYKGEKQYNVAYLGAPAWGPKKVKESDAEAKLRALFGGGDSEEVDAEVVEPEKPSKKAPPADENPFA